MSAVATRFRTRSGDDYVLCPEDGSWFRPLYTDGKCPLCGEPVAEEERELPPWMRVDGVQFGIATLIVVSLVMTAVVLYTYFA